MTALCGGGTSSQRPGTPQLAYVTGSEIVSLIAGAFDVPAWIAIAAYAAAQEFVLANLCATDPPAMPTFVPSDISDILAPAPDMQSPGIVKLGQLATIAAWHTFCQCDTAATPAPPAAPVYPPGAPQLQPPAIAPSTAGPCWTLELHPNATTAGTDMWPHSNVVANPCGTGPGHDMYRSCMAATSFQLTFTVNNEGTNVHPWTWSYTATDPSGVITNQNTWQVQPGATFDTGVINLGANWSHLTMNVGSNDGFPFGTNSAVAKSQVWCNTAPIGSPVVPCCPPDPVLQGRLDQLFSMLKIIYAQLGQQLHPWVDGVRHAGLTGGGSLTFTDAALGVRVEIKNLPAGWPEIVQVPPYLISAGFITPTAEGVPMRGSRLIYQNQTYPLDRQATGISWQLPPELRIDIVELLQGP